MNNAKNMNALTRWNPSREFGHLRNRIDSLFDVFAHGDGGTGNGELSAWAGWTPPVDIEETDNEYVIKAELPGLKKEDVDVTLNNGVLTISGERKHEKEEKNRRYHYVECSYGSFSRSFSLPGGADLARVGAQFKDGVLRVRVAKSEAAKPKQIEVMTD